jgi:hypothetical protein
MYNSKLEKFKDLHKGKSVIIFATGPSIKRYKPFDGSESCIKVGLNRIYDYKELVEDIDYYYYGSHFTSDSEHRENLKRVCSMKGITSFASAYENGRSHKDIGRGNVSPEQALELGSIPFENNLMTFTNDIAKYSTLGHSIIFPPLQHMLYMGFSEVYLVGCDGGFTKSLASGDTHLLYWWEKFKVFKEEYYKDVKITSINPISLKGWFNDAYIG